MNVPSHLVKNVISKEQFDKCFPFSSAKSRLRFFEPLMITMNEFEITTKLRIAAFLAQIAHESGSLRYTLEIYGGEIYDVGRKAVSLGNTPEDDGDGEKYRGRGLIQITGTTNYKKLFKHFDVGWMIEDPHVLEEPFWASISAGWYWHDCNLNSLADQGDFRKITKLINGGYNGWDDRLQHYERNLKVL